MATGSRDSLSKASPAKLRVAAVQMKFAPTIQGNLESIGRFLALARRRRADVVLFPECAVTGYRHDFSTLRAAGLRRALEMVGEMTARAGVCALLGSPVFRGGKLCNALVAFDRTGAPVHCYAKCHLTEFDRRWFVPGNAVALFEIAGVCATAIICHERRYPELVRLGVMAGARLVFHPNAGLDSLAVSRMKRHGRDGIAARAFENAVPYVFANSVGPQGGRLWSAGDSKIVSSNSNALAQAGNEREELIVADVELSGADGVYARRALVRPRFLASSWRLMLRRVRGQAVAQSRLFDLPWQGTASK